MFCISCDVQILSEEDVCFYYKNDTSVHLIAKHERSIIIEDKFKSCEILSKCVKIRCLNCDSPIGKKCPFGHRNSMDYFFAHDKVTILHAALKRGEKWQHVYRQEPFNTISSRNSENYFGYLMPSENPKKINFEANIAEKGIVFPDSQDAAQFTYDDILMSDRVPYDYQVTSYIEALQRDLILVLPTGYGKTLIASIVAARMIRLNPDHMVLFIVDRIPLVFQQAEAISVDTHLKVCPLTGENNNDRIRRRLQTRDFHVLVSTAGAYLECKLGVDAFCCVIIDECHHATKKHNYVGVLDSVRPCPVRPRVIGLTASPPSNKNSKDSTQKLLTEFRSYFSNAPILHNLNVNSQVRADAAISLKVIAHSPDPGIKSYQALLEREFNRLAVVVNESLGGNVVRKEDWENPTNRANLIRVLECLNCYASEMLYRPIKCMKRIYQVLENTELMGVTYANETLRDMEFYEELDSQTNYSPRVLFLLEILNQLPDSSKIIIFVLTRKIAHILLTILKSSSQVNERFSPLKLVGQSGPLGMSWQHEQEVALNSFRKGSCNLLVSTPVLEEGQDIPCCDVVIRFDGIKSLISFKQSRGRARKWESGQFILILSARELQLYQSIQEQESLVREVLDEHHVDSQVPSTRTREIQEHITKRSAFSDPWESAIQTAECAVELCLPGRHEMFQIQDSIAEFFRENYFLFLTHIDMAGSNKKWKCRGIFPSEDSLLNLGLQTQSRNAYQRYRQLSVEWSFCLEGVAGNVWTRIEVLHNAESIRTKWPLQEMVWGNFDDRHSFIQNKSLEFPEHASLEFLYERFLRIRTEGMVIEIALTSIHRFILTNWEKQHVTLYIPLAHSPVICDARPGTTSVRFTADTCECLEWFRKYPIVGLTIPYERNNWSQLWVLLHSPPLLPVPLFESRVLVIRPSQAVREDGAVADSDEVRECAWLFSILKANRNVCLARDAIKSIEKKLNQVSDFRILKVALSKIVASVSQAETNYFFDFEGIFSEYLSFPPTSSLPPPNYRYIECAMVTPSRLVPLYPVLTQCNRLYRRYPRVRFLNLAFREEDEGELRDRRVIERVKNVLEKGLCVCGARFYFLVCSSSQLRSKRAVFIQIEEELAADRIKEMRQLFIGETVIKNETKFLSRLGLFCTSDHPTLEMREEETLCLRDIQAGNGLLVTDGAGKIRRSLALNVLGGLREDRDCPPLDSVTALQVRLAGLKGVLTIVDGDVDPDFKQHPDSTIMYRESMKKIDWPKSESTLCIVKLGKYNKLCLNIQMLNLLTSLEDGGEGERWDPKPRLRTLYTRQLERFARIFTDYEIAQKELVQNLPNYFEQTCLYFDILREPYFLKVLRCVYTYNIRNLIDKVHIPIEQGCLLMGIPDPIGVLKDGEVFITFQEGENKSKTIWEGRVLVYKNPCLHPGDLLTPTAVDKQELRRLHNVIVFSIRASTSLPACSGGGDLDGDEFAVIWDQGLIPPPSAAFPPLNYDELLKSHKPEPAEGSGSDILLQDDPNIQSRLAEAYCSVVSNESLGIIAHYHLSICDQKSAGARDPLSIQLAESASLAVDSPKTGIIPVIPDEAKRLISQNGYPDFMQKRESTSFRSQKLLGEVYHLAKEVCYETSEWTDILNYDGKHNLGESPAGTLPLSAFQLPGYLQFAEDASARYREYCTGVQRLMLAFGVGTEAEVVSGLVVKCHPLLTADKGKMTNSMAAATTCLTQEFRDKFHSKTPETDYLKKAAAWYSAVYQPQQREELACHSFAWLVPEYLCQILQAQELRVTNNVHSAIGQSIQEYLLTQREYIRTSVESKLCVLPVVKSAINEQLTNMYPSREVCEIDKMFDVIAFGSTSVYLCDMQSDLDISVSLTGYGASTISESAEFQGMELTRRRRHLINNFLSPVIGKIAAQSVSKLGSEVPIISFTIDSPRESCSQVCVDITVDSDGVLKSQCIRESYRRTGGVFYGWLWILVHWARHVGILKCQNSENTGIILTAEFEALVLHIYNLMDFKSVDDNVGERDCSLDSLFNSIIQKTNSLKLGLMLEEFFRRGYQIISDAEQDVVFTWPIEGEPTHTIYTAALDKISTLFFQAWHCLVFTRDVSKLFERVHSQSSINKRFSSRVSDQIRLSAEFYRKTLSCSTGAAIKMRNMGSNILLTGYGTPSALHKLSAEISLLEKNTALSKRYRSYFNRYMMDGCATMIMANSARNCRVQLSPFTDGCFKDFHFKNNRSIVLPMDDEVNENWKKEGVADIQTLFWNQVSEFPANATIGALQLKTRFGFFYVLDAVESFQHIGGSLTLEEFQSCLQRNVKYRKEINCGIEDISLSNKQFPSSGILGSSQHNIPQRGIQPKVSKQNEAKHLGCAFCPGIQMTENSDQICQARSLFENALLKFGFRPKDCYQTYAWRLDIQVSASREVRLNLDENLVVTSVTERPLIWMLATIVGDRRTPNQKRVHDLRIRAESAKPLRMDSDLCQSLFQQDKPSDLFSLNEDGSPMPSELIKHRFTIIKHNTMAIFYEYDDTIAKISFGDEYCRENVNFKRQYCELSLYHSREDLKEIVGTENCCIALQTLAAKALDISLRLSENITETP